MPDISMCARTDCSVAGACRRHEDSGTVPSSPWQSWGEFGPPGPGCRGFWPIIPITEGDEQ